MRRRSPGATEAGFRPARWAAAGLRLGSPSQEGQSQLQSRLPPLLRSTCHTHFPSSFSRRPVSPSTNIYSFIHSKHLCPARQQVQQSSHMQGPLKMLLHVPKPSYLRPRVSGKQFHIPSSWPPSSTERIKTQGRLFTDFFLVLPYLFISIIWIQKSAQLNLTLQ